MAVSTPDTGSRMTRARTSKHSTQERSRLILSGTTAAVGAILTVWLLIASFFSARVGALNLASLALLGPEGTEGEIVLSSIDLLDPEGDGQSFGLDAAAFESQLDEFLNSRAEEPRVIALTGLGISILGPPDAPRAFLVPSEGSPVDIQSLVPLDRILERIRSKASARSPVFLILDVSPVVNNPDLGFFGGSLVRWLETAVQSDDPILVMTACAPGQKSWSAEPSEGSVFLQYVRRGLEQSGVTAKSLHEYVAPRVAGWVRKHRAGAFQTPLLIGNVRRFDFRLPRLRPLSLQDPVEASPLVESEEFMAIQDAWARKLGLDEKRAFLTSPLLWRVYVAAILNAERLVRAKKLSEAGIALSAAESLANRLDGQMEVRLPEEGWTLAAYGRSASSEGDEAALQSAIQSLLNGSAIPGVEAPAGQVSSTTKPPSEDAEPSGSNSTLQEPSPEVGSNPTQSSRQGQIVSRGSFEAVRRSRVSELRPLQRYIEFVELGGESDLTRELRRSRLELAYRTSTKAELAAVVGPNLLSRLSAWVQPLVNRADAIRLPAQDKLFGDRAGLLEESASGLSDAERLYDVVISMRRDLILALEHVAEVQANAPYYGDWLVHRRKDVKPLTDLLHQTAQLADALEVPPARDEDSTSLLKINQLRVAIARSWERIQSDFRSELQRALSTPDRPSWLELNAFLEVPTIDPNARAKLILELESRPGIPSDSTESGFGSIDEAIPEPSPDPGFWQEAEASCRVQIGLLRLAGISDEKLAAVNEDVQTLSLMKVHNPSAAFEALDEFSAAVRQLRLSALNMDSLEAVRREHNDLTKARSILLAADRAARVLPAGELRRQVLLDNDPTEMCSNLERHVYLNWQAERAMSDMAIDAARMYLDASRTYLESSDREAAYRRLTTYSTPQAIRVEESESSPGRLQLNMEGQSELPAGFAVVVLQHDPSIDLRVTTEGEIGNEGGAMIAVPIAGTISRTFVVSNPGNPKELPAVAPTVLYRGVRYALPNRVAIQPQGELVSVQLRQSLTSARVQDRGKTTTLKIPDQFEFHPMEGYLHPNSDVAYNVVLTNNSPEKLNLVVLTSISGKPPGPPIRLTLNPGDSSESEVKGRVAHFDFKEPDDTVSMKVEVRRDTTDGPLVSDPKEFAFKILEPNRYIKITLAYSAPYVFLRVDHLNSSPVFVPALVTVQVEPLNAVQQIGRVQEWIGHGDHRFYKYWILDHTIPTLNFKLQVDGEELKFDPVALKALPKVLEAPPETSTPPQTPQGGNPGGFNGMR